MSTNTAVSSKKPYPMAGSIAIIVFAVILSFVDLAFLNDVIGKVLDLDTVTSLAIAFAIGLIGIGVMAHLGMKIAHGMDDKRTVIGHYALWIFLGLALVLIRIFSASIMQLDLSLGDVSLVNILGHNIRQVDIITAPLMFFMYLATGTLVKDGVKNLYLNPEFEEWRVNRKKTKADRLTANEKRAKAAEERIEKQREKQEEAMHKRAEQVEAGRLANARHGSYSNALAQFRAAEKAMQDKYQLISANIDFVKSIDKQEQDFELKIKPGLMKIVNESIHSIQNSVALALRKKTGEDIKELRHEIESYNASRHE